MDKLMFYMKNKLFGAPAYPHPFYPPDEGGVESKKVELP